MLPSPTSSRFQPLRSGLINLFKYQDQEFWYERGRLLVRGNNGTGKSRVLALQLPFLLDGEISPSRVEPDGDPNRQIAWHLLMDDQFEQRTGYTWIEFGRRAQDGSVQIVTLGCGMRAIKGGDNQPTRWFFITDHRIGRDFSLLQDAHPLNADRLEEILGKESLFKAAGPYRAEVDKRLFGIGADRYESLIKLLIRLRAPQLAKKLEAEKLFSALSDALPELPNPVVLNLATAFKGLDSLRKQAEELLNLSRALATFHTGYRAYLQTALLRRAAVLRSRHSEYEHAQRNVGRIEQEITAAHENEESAGLALSAAKDVFAAADARLVGLQQSDRAHDAQTLDYAQQTANAEQQRANQAAIDAQRATERLDAVIAEIDANDTQLRQNASALTLSAREASRLATAAGFAADHARVIPDPLTWPADPDASPRLKAAHAQAAGDHEHRLHQIDTRLGEVETAEKAVTRAQHTETQLANALSALSEQAVAHDTSARAAIVLLADAYQGWHRALRWLVLPPWSELSPACEDWLETADEAHRRLGPSLAHAVSRESASLATARENLAARGRALDAERQMLLAERTALEAGPPPPPFTPATRDAAARANRPGAPFWQLCEFRASLTTPERAGLEAALEAAGLLDAWILPDGTVHGDLPADTFLSTHGPAPSSAPTLADWLQPDASLAASSPVPAAVVQRVLTHLGAGPGTSQHWVALDGRWQLGPVLGRGRKEAAVHLGATGREAARQRRLAELAAALDLLDKRLAALTAESAQLGTRAAGAEAEHRAAPSDHEIARWLTLRTETRRQHDEASLKHAAAQQETYRARQRLQSANDTLHRDARDLGYGEHLHRLRELRPALAPYAQAMVQLWADAQAWITSTQHRERLTARQRTCDEESSNTAALAESARHAALRAAESHRALAETLGASIEEYQRELTSARLARNGAQTALDGANTAVTSAAQARSGLEASLAPAREKIGEAEQRRQAAIFDLRLPLHHGLFAEAHPDLTDIETEEWSPTRAYTIARRLDNDLPTADLAEPAWTDRLNLLNTQINDLRTLTGALGCQVVSRVLGEGLTLVTCHYQGSPLTPAHCLAAVEGERATRERLLSDKESEIIDRHLVTEVSFQLQTLINGASDRVEAMNQEMKKCATTLGIALKLVWESASEGLPAGLPQVRKLLLADHAAWTDDERATVGRFLHQLIKDERLRNPAAPATEQLLRALDYRAWHAFAAERHQNNRWERLTRKRYGTGSGGEKALMLTIPQMAAASSHYKNAAPHAPRLILLDEAFAGMDKPTRARCMGLLEAFDLDLLMTSEREWGAHSTISGIAIYQLVADADAIAATRWVWNGHKPILSPVPDTPELRSPTAAPAPKPPASESNPGSI